MEKTKQALFYKLVNRNYVYIGYSIKTTDINEIYKTIDDDMMMCNIDKEFEYKYFNHFYKNSFAEAIEIVDYSKLRPLHKLKKEYIELYTQAGFRIINGLYFN